MVTHTQERVGAARVAVALDVDTLEQAERLADALSGHVGVFKVGLELFSAYGPEAVRRIAEHGPVFLDLKLHDIPNTVERATRRLAALGVAYVTVHASGGPAMIAAAVTGLGDNGTILGVTALTSLSADDLGAVGLAPAEVTVPQLARLATDAGAGGIVCAAPEVTAVRAVVPAGTAIVTPGIRPTGTAIVTPGIRPAGADADDQARVATPARAVADGATLLVVGRPITRADDPVAAADAIAATPLA